MKPLRFPKTLKLIGIAVTALVLAAVAVPLFAQEGPLKNVPPPNGLTPQEIIQRFAAKEKVFQQARDNYTYTQDVTVETLDGDTVTGQYREVFDVLFDDSGKRIEHVNFAPQSTLDNGGISMSPEDLNDIRHLLPFVLTTDQIPEYDILYVGQQQEDELHCYVFDLAPKTIEKGKRYFQGRIWVDDQDFQIVKTQGKTVPDIRKKKGEENLFPAFSTWRQQVDGQYWFPVYTLADDVLHFSGPTGDVHIKEIVKYTNYKRFGSNVRITYEGQELPTDKPGQQPGAQQQPAQPGQQPQTKPPAPKKPDPTIPH